MQAIKLNIVLFFAVFMFAAKPFVGFSLYKQLLAGNTNTILNKAFTKRKLEYIENGQLDVKSIQQRLGEPLEALTLLFTSLLAAIFPAIFNLGKKVTSGVLANIHLILFPPQQLYLLSGKLSI